MGEERMARLLSDRNWNMIGMVKDKLTTLLKTYY